MSYPITQCVACAPLSTVVRRLLFVALAGLIGCDLKELLSPSGPLGTSTMSAVVDGDYVSFGSVSATSYFGTSATASSRDYRVRLYLGLGDVGSHTWGPYRGMMLSSDTSAFLNDRQALGGWGGFTITTDDSKRRRLVGSFSFAIGDTVAADTMFVTQGRFELFYPFAD